jgi:isopenicillin-N N-acyltransferase like protein
MNDERLRVLEIEGEPTHLGRAHGSAYGSLIREYLADRLGLSGDATWAGSSAPSDLVLDLATQTLAHHRDYAAPLYEEMESMAAAAGISPAEAVVVGGFTDLVDMVRARQGMAPIEDDCTAVLDPEAGVLAQTWDMHASAGHYVVMLRIEPDTGPSAVVQTTVGCLGQIGMNEAGIAVGINNLTSIGKPGVTWPFVVRKALQQTTLDAAVDAVLEADLSGGHNYLLMGPDGTGANIEAMPGSVEVTRVVERPFVHTNHCLVDATRSEEGSRTPEHVTGSQTRLDRGHDLARDLDGFFAEPAIARRATEPHDVATCGAVKIYPGKRRFESVWGVPGDHEWETFDL